MVSARVVLVLLAGCRASGDVEVALDLQAPGSPIGNPNGVQGPPVLRSFPDMDLRDAYREMAVPIVRFPQDDGPLYALEGIFPDPAADPEDPAAYRFEDVDGVVQAILDTGARPLWQSIYDIGPNERQGAGCCQAGDPPDDPARWAAVVAHVLMHWNDGWADGHAWDVLDVEFINEPETCGGFGPSAADVISAWRFWADGLTRYEAGTGRDVTAWAPALAWDEGTDPLDKYLPALPELVEQGGLDVLSAHTYRSTPWGVYEHAVEIAEVADYLGVRVANSEWNVERDGSDTDWTDAESHLDGVWTATARILVEPVLDASVVYRAPPHRSFPDQEETVPSPFFDLEGGRGPLPGWWSFAPFADLAGAARLEAPWDRALAEESGAAVLAGIGVDGGRPFLGVLLSSVAWSGDVVLVLGGTDTLFPDGAQVEVYRVTETTTAWSPVEVREEPSPETFTVEVQAPDLWYVRWTAR